MYDTIMAITLVAAFVLYFVLSGRKDRMEYEQELKDKYGDNP